MAEPKDLSLLSTEELFKTLGNRDLAPAARTLLSRRNDQREDISAILAGNLSTYANLSLLLEVLDTKTPWKQNPLARNSDAVLPLITPYLWKHYLHQLAPLLPTIWTQRSWRIPRVFFDLTERVNIYRPRLVEPSNPDVALHRLFIAPYDDESLEFVLESCQDNEIRISLLAHVLSESRQLRDKSLLRVLGFLRDSRQHTRHLNVAAIQLWPLVDIALVSAVEEIRTTALQQINWILESAGTMKKVPGTMRARVPGPLNAFLARLARLNFDLENFPETNNLAAFWICPYLLHSSPPVRAKAWLYVLSKKRLYNMIFLPFGREMALTRHIGKLIAKDSQFQPAFIEAVTKVPSRVSRVRILSEAVGSGARSLYPFLHLLLRMETDHAVLVWSLKRVAPIAPPDDLVRLLVKAIKYPLKDLLITAVVDIVLALVEGERIHCTAAWYTLLEPVLARLNQGEHDRIWRSLIRFAALVGGGWEESERGYRLFGYNILRKLLLPYLPKVTVGEDATNLYSEELLYLNDLERPQAPGVLDPRLVESAWDALSKWPADILRTLIFERQSSVMSRSYHGRLIAVEIDNMPRSRWLGSTTASQIDAVADAAYRRARDSSTPFAKLFFLKPDGGSIEHLLAELCFTDHPIFRVLQFTAWQLYWNRFRGSDEAPIRELLDLLNRRQDNAQSVNAVACLVGNVLSARNKSFDIQTAVDLLLELLRNQDTNHDFISNCLIAIAQVKHRHAWIDLQDFDQLLRRHSSDPEAGWMAFAAGFAIGLIDHTYIPDVMSFEKEKYGLGLGLGMCLSNRIIALDGLPSLTKMWFHAYMCGGFEPWFLEETEKMSKKDPSMLFAYTIPLGMVSKDPMADAYWTEEMKNINRVKSSHHLLAVLLGLGARAGLDYLRPHPFTPRVAGEEVGILSTLAFNPPTQILGAQKVSRTAQVILGLWHATANTLEIREPADYSRLHPKSYVRRSVQSPDYALLASVNAAFPLVDWGQITPDTEVTEQKFRFFALQGCFSPSAFSLFVGMDPILENLRVMQLHQVLWQLKDELDTPAHVRRLATKPRKLHKADISSCRLVLSRAMESCFQMKPKARAQIFKLLLKSAPLPAPLQSVLLRTFSTLETQIHDLASLPSNFRDFVRLTFTSEEPYLRQKGPSFIAQLARYVLSRPRHYCDVQDDQIRVGWYRDAFELTEVLDDILLRGGALKLWEEVRPTDLGGWLMQKKEPERLGIIRRLQKLGLEPLVMAQMWVYYDGHPFDSSELEPLVMAELESELGKDAFEPTAAVPEASQDSSQGRESNA